MAQYLSDHLSIPLE